MWKDQTSLTVLPERYDAITIRLLVSRVNLTATNVILS